MEFVNLKVKYKQFKILSVIIFISLSLANDVAPNNPKDRIVGLGGHPCEGKGNESFSHVVAITSLFGYPICTGSLLSSTWVLTAAHCSSLFTVFYVTPAHVRDKCMSTKRHKYFLPKSCPSTRASSWYYHPHWSDMKTVNDVALMKLASPIHKSNYVQYVKLPSIPVKGTGPDLCPESTVMGFGRIYKHKTEMPKKTMCLNLKLLYKKDCKKRLYTYLTTDMNKKICGNSTKQDDVCFGDSGGPLMCGDTQIGISSFIGGSECASGAPSVFTRVDRHLKFIREITNRGIPTVTVGLNFLILLNFYIGVTLVVIRVL